MLEKILNKEILNQLYIIQGESIAEIARTLNTTLISVSKYMKIHDIVFRDHPSKPKDISQQRFGKLVAQHLCKGNGKRSRWFCSCDCGNNTIVNVSSLLSGLTTSCGCYKLELCHKGHYKDISSGWWRKLVKGAVQRGYKFEIVPEDVWDIYEKQNRKCIFTNISIQFYPGAHKANLQTASLDRINSSLGYTKTNIQIVHKVINQMKGYLSDEEFIAFCNEVARTKSMDHESCSNTIALRTIMRK